MEASFSHRCNNTELHFPKHISEWPLEQNTLNEFRICEFIDVETLTTNPKHDFVRCCGAHALTGVLGESHGRIYLLWILYLALLGQQ
jgi:hypothetical protein